MKEGGESEPAQPKADTGFIARARARIARMNATAEGRRRELGLPPEAKFELLQPHQDDQAPTQQSQEVVSDQIDGDPSK